MNTFNRKATALVGLVALSLIGSFSVSAAEQSHVPADSSTCHQVKRLSPIWPPGGSKSPIRWESKQVTVCGSDAKSKSDAKPSRTASAPTWGPRYR